MERVRVHKLEERKVGANSRGVCVCGCVRGCVRVVAGCRGHRASSSQGPADTNTGIQEQLDPSSSPFTSLPPSLPPRSTLALRNAGWTFFFPFFCRK